MSDRHTLAGPVELSQEIKKSRFLCHAAPIASAPAALDYLDAIADAQATHNCWAYRLGQAYRFSDDGEPGGTAGRPILQAIEGQGFDRVMVVVTRYYGGIKLGAGGLVRAYGGCAAECLRNAPRLVLVDRREVEFFLGFAELPRFDARLGDLAAEKLEENFNAEGATLRVSLPAARLDEVRRLLADLTRGRAQLRLLD